ncbi:MAG: c-type cytochrome domain-containing protein [Bacteroidota bacterium]
MYGKKGIHASTARRRKVGVLAVILWMLFGHSACTWHDINDVAHNFPAHIEPLLRTACATPGCHTDQSAQGAAGLNLETWEALFDGAVGGSAVVPYNAEQSYLLQFLNVDTSWGPVTAPTMPLNGTPLSPLQLQDVIDWINEGARNAMGEERFPPAANRRKWYVVNRGCDLITVFDAESKQTMRMIEVGTDEVWTEGPNELLMSKDGAHWYTLQYNDYVEQYSALTDEKVGQILLDDDTYNVGVISEDGRFMFIVSQLLQQMSVLDLEAGTQVAGPVAIPHFSNGIALHPSRSQVYLAGVESSDIFVYDYDAAGQLLGMQQIDMVQGRNVPASGYLWVNDFFFHPNGEVYYITCQGTGEIRVVDAANDSVINVISVAAGPSEFAYDATTNRLFVSCTEEQAMHGFDPKKRGMIAVVDLGTETVEQYIYSGFQPHGIAIDPVDRYLVVANRNVDPNGPVPHHGSSCSGRNGNVALIDLSTLQVVPGFKPEVSVDPYRVVVK